MRDGCALLLGNWNKKTDYFCNEKSKRVKLPPQKGYKVNIPGVGPLVWQRADGQNIGFAIHTRTKNMPPFTNVPFSVLNFTSNKILGDKMININPFKFLGYHTHFHSWVIKVKWSAINWNWDRDKTFSTLSNFCWVFCRKTPAICLHATFCHI